MITMQSIMGSDGPLVEVELTLSRADLRSLRAKGSPLPQPFSVRALIDSGAEVSCIDKQLTSSLIATGMPPGRFLFANMPAVGGLSPTIEYVVSLTLLHPSRKSRSHLVLPSLPVVEQPLGQLGYQALLGRDVLERCLLVYDGPGRSFTLAF